jgi:hypothetical protein
MPKALGDVVSSAPSYEETHTTDGTPTAGDAVAIDQSTNDPNKVTQANSGDTDAGEELAAIAPEDHGADGHTETVVHMGVVIANVASAVVAGNRLSTSATDGQLAASSGGEALALSDAGGSWRGHSLGSNEAAVFVGA